MNAILTEKSKELFLILAQDAGNWGGTPLLGGNFSFTKEDRGNLSDLKKKGLVYTFKEERDEFVGFTDEGKAYAATLGFDLNF
ncbi:MAG: hypothetical protein EB120_13660 [Proteobacteria bacterium]|nr:hypothetical protein [Pseudomonadota bacterium]